MDSIIISIIFNILRQFYSVNSSDTKPLNSEPNISVDRGRIKHRQPHVSRTPDTKASAQKVV